MKFFKSGNLMYLPLIGGNIYMAVSTIGVILSLIQYNEAIIRKDHPEIKEYATLEEALNG